MSYVPSCKQENKPGILSKLTYSWNSYILV